MKKLTLLLIIFLASCKEKECFVNLAEVYINGERICCLDYNTIEYSNEDTFLLSKDGGEIGYVLADSVNIVSVECWE